MLSTLIYIDSDSEVELTDNKENNSKESCLEDNQLKMLNTTIYIDSDDDEIEVTVIEENKSPEQCLIVDDVTDALVEPCGPSKLDTMNSSNVAANELRLLSVLEAYMNVNNKYCTNDKEISDDKDDNDAAFSVPSKAGFNHKVITQPEVAKTIHMNKENESMNRLNEYESHLVDVIDLMDDSLKTNSRPSSPVLHLQHGPVIDLSDIDVTINKKPSPTASESNDKHTKNLSSSDTFAFLLQSFLEKLHSDNVIAEPAIINDKTSVTCCSENTGRHAKPLSSIPLLNDIQSTEEAMDINTNENVINENSVPCTVGLTKVKAFTGSLESELPLDNVDINSVTNPSTSDIINTNLFDELSVSNTDESIGKTSFAKRNDVQNVSQNITAVGQKNDSRFKFLIHKFKELKKKITDLEEKEVDLNDDENSDFFVIEEYKMKAFTIYEKICEITGQNKPSVKQRVKFEATKYPEFNLKLEKMINDKGNLPHVLDVRRCLEICNREYNYQLPKDSCHKIAKKAFSHIGKTSKKRRKLDLDEMLSYYSRNTEPDPALLDAELNAKFNANKKLCRR